MKLDKYKEHFVVELECIVEGNVGRSIYLTKEGIMEGKLKELLEGSYEEIKESSIVLKDGKEYRVLINGVYVEDISEVIK